MTAKLHHTKWAPATVTPSTEASGYDADNILTASIGRAWRSTTTAGTTTLLLDLGAEYYVAAVALNHCNASSVAVSYGDAAAPTAPTSAGTLTTYVDGQGRRKGSLDISQETVRYIKFSFTGTPADGAAYWAVGSAYVFGATLTLPRDPLMGSEQAIDWPQATERLPNGRMLRIDRGVSRIGVKLRFTARITDDMEAALRYARLGPAWLDLGLPAAQWCQWPMEHADDGQVRQWAGHNREPLVMTLRELA